MESAGTVGEAASAAERLESMKAQLGKLVKDSTPAQQPVSVGEQHARGKQSSGVPSSIEERALKLLGSGIAPESVAAALGVTPARISQLLSEEHFAHQVSSLRYENLQKHNTRDANYDSLEDTLIEKLESALPLMHKPQEILRAISVINKAQRRGQSAPAQITDQQNIVNLVLPSVVAERFTVNIDNQVTRAGDQELHTMPSSNLLKKVNQAREEKNLLDSTLDSSPQAQISEDSDDSENKEVLIES